MLFESTRGGDKAKTFEEVLLKGLADDGGLYIPTAVSYTHLTLPTKA